MKLLTSFRKTAFASFMVILCSGSCHHSSAQLPKNQAPHRAASQSKVEVQLNKEEMSQRDDKK